MGNQLDIFEAMALPTVPFPSVRLPLAFHNTIELAGAELSEAVATCKHQDVAVLAIYQSFGRPLTPSAVWQYGIARGSTWLLTSVRRSISNLTDAGKLVKGGLKPGPYGKPEHEWSMVP